MNTKEPMSLSIKERYNQYLAREFGKMDAIRFVARDLRVTAFEVAIEVGEDRYFMTH